MSTIRQGLLNTNNPIAAVTTELNSLASNGVVLSNTVVSNIQGDTHGLGYPRVKGQLKLGSAAYTGGSIFVWFLLSRNSGTSYDSYVSTTPTTTAPSSKVPDLIFTPDAVTAVFQREIYAAFGAPICDHIKCLIWNNSGIALPSSGNSFNLYFETDEFN